MSLEGIDIGQCLLPHRCLYVATLAIDLVKDTRMLRCRRLVVSEQAFDADRDVLEPARRIDARPGDETEIRTDSPRQLPSRLGQQGTNSGSTVHGPAR